MDNNNDFFFTGNDEDSPDGQQQQLFVTYDTMTQRAAGLSENVASLRSEQEQAREGRHARLQAM